MRIEEMATMTYFQTTLSDQIRDNTAERPNEIRIEYAAPTVPYGGTRMRKANKKTITLTAPITKRNFGLSKLLNFEIALESMTAGRIAIARIINELLAA